MTTNKDWNRIEEEFRKKYVVKSNAGTGLLRYTDADSIVAFFKPYFQEELHTRVVEELGIDCQWENCSGGRYCENHSLERKPESSWEEEFIEKGAYIEHARWSKWQKYMHSKIMPTEHDDLMQIGIEFIERWNRQIETPYSELSEQEKQSDKNEVMPYVNWHKQSLRQFIDGLVEYEQEYVDVINRNDNGTKHEEGCRDGKEMTISYLKEIRKQLE